MDGNMRALHRSGLSTKYEELHLHDCEDILDCIRSMQVNLRLYDEEGPHPRWTYDIPKQAYIEEPNWVYRIGGLPVAGGLQGGNHFF